MISFFENLGIKVTATPEDGLNLKGLSGLTDETRQEVLDFARENKTAILSELSELRFNKINELEIFSYNDKSIRTIMDEKGNPWFVAKDVADILGYSDTDDAIRRHCKLSKLFKPGETPGLGCGPRGMMFIPEPDVYRLVAKSTLPAAEKFEVWLFEEVLPAIRKHGMYGTPSFVESALSDPDTMIRTLQALKDERKKRLELEAESESLRLASQSQKIQIAIDAAKIAKDKPLVEFAKTIEGTDNKISIGDIAKLSGKIGRNNLFKKMREEKILIGQGRDTNKPFQKYIDRGYFEVTETIIKRTHGDKIVFTTLVTGTGQTWLIGKILEWGKNKCLVDIKKKEVTYGKYNVKIGEIIKGIHDFFIKVDSAYISSYDGSYMFEGIKYTIGGNEYARKNRGCISDAFGINRFNNC